MRDEDAIIVEWRLEGPGVDIDHFGWAEYREFVNRLVSALEALPDGPSARNILPVQIFGGSVRVSTRMLHRHLTAVRALQRGPTATWTPRQLRRAENLYGWVRRQGAALHVAAPGHASERVIVPAASMNEAREATTLPGKVHRVGGKLGKVDIEFDGDGIVACSAGRQLAERLGAHLYQPVFVSGRAWRDATGRLVAFSIESYSAAPQLVPATEGVRRLHALLGSTLDDFDPRSILEERRA